MNGSKSLLVCAVIALVATIVSAPVNAQLEPGSPPRPAPKTDQTAKEKSVPAEGQKRAKLETAAPGFCRCVGEDDSAAVARIEQVLSASLHPTGLDYADQPLQDVVTQLQDDYGIPVQLNKAALEEAGIGTDTPVTVNLHNVSFRSALRLMLKQLQLTYVIQDEVLLITTKSDAEAQLKVCVYDVRKILGDNAALEPVVDTITSCVAKETWAKNGKGAAEIRPLKPGLLVITQTQAMHDEIRNLLTTLRNLSHERPQAAGVAAPSAAGNDLVVTRSYLLQLNPTKDINAMRKQVGDLITQSLPNETLNGKLENGEAATLTVFHDRVVVHHRPAVQEKVRKILCDSGIAAPAQAPQPSPDIFGTAGPAATYAPTPAGAGAPSAFVEAVPVPTPVPAPALVPLLAPSPEGEAPAEAAPAGVAPGPDAAEGNPFG